MSRSRSRHTRKRTMIERVCTTIPRCWCHARSRYECNCVQSKDTDGALICENCGSDMVTVSKFEVMMTEVPISRKPRKRYAR